MKKAPIPVEIMQRLEIALIHHGQIGPQLYHLCCPMDEHVPFMVGLLIPKG